MECDHCGKDTDKPMFKMYTMTNTWSMDFYLCKDCQKKLRTFLKKIDSSKNNFRKKKQTE